MDLDKIKLTVKEGRRWEAEEVVLVGIEVVVVLVEEVVEEVDQ